MKYTMVLTLTVMVAMLVMGCGIPKEEFARSQKELANSRAATAERDKAISELTGKLETCEKDKKKCGEDLTAADEKYQVCVANSSKTSDELKSLGAEYTETRDQLAQLKKANDLRQKAMDELLSKFSTLINSGRLSIGINDGRMVIQLSSNVLFDVGRAKLSKDGKTAVEEVAEVLKTIDGRKFQVAGHTDNQKGRNWTLSYQRARSVFDVLVKAEMNESLLSIAAYGEYSPVASNDTPEGQDANRRIEIVLLPTSEELPLKQLKKIEKIIQKQ